MKSRGIWKEDFFPIPLFTFVPLIQGGFYAFGKYRDSKAKEKRLSEI